MAIYLVDLENVHASGINNISNYPQDTFYIFYSDNINSIPISLHDRLKGLSNYRFIHVNSNGKNALDFQLSTYLGYLIAYKPKETFYIISADNGFSNVTKFWADLNFKVSLMPRIGGYAESDKIKNILNSYKSKQDIHNAIIKAYGMEKGPEIYNQIKHLIKEDKA